VSPISGGQKLVLRFAKAEPPPTHCPAGVAFKLILLVGVPLALSRLRPSVRRNIGTAETERHKVIILVTASLRPRDAIPSEIQHLPQTPGKRGGFRRTAPALSNRRQQRDRLAERAGFEPRLAELGPKRRNVCPPMMRRLCSQSAGPGSRLVRIPLSQAVICAGEYAFRRRTGPGARSARHRCQRNRPRIPGAFRRWTGCLRRTD
jgi:hypothetical protein